jgi:hypothetical protein
MESHRSEPANDRELARARALARLLDSAVGIPGTPIRVGADAVLGLIPGVGDVLSALLSGHIVLIASRRGAPSAVLWRMIANVAIDTAIGSVPLLGDLFDVAYRSNVRNVELLERYAAQPAAVTARSRMLRAIVVLVILLLLIGVVTIGVLLARALWRLLTG